MAGLFKTPKVKVPPAPKIPDPKTPPPAPTGPAETSSPEISFLRSRRRKGSGLSSLILTPLGAGTNPQAPKQTLGQ